VTPAPQANSAFSPTIPNLQLAWDSTSFNALDKCPRYYHLSIVLGHRGSGPPNDDQLFGLLSHAADETYEHQRARGVDHEAAVRHVVYCLLINTWDFVHSRPWISSISSKTRETLIRLTILYLDTYENDPLRTVIKADGRPAVEVSFNFDLSEVIDGFKAPSGENYLLCGHLDKVVEWNNDYWIVDKKTTGHALDDNYFTQYAPDNQMTIYQIAGNIVLHKPVVGVMINAAQTLTETVPRFRRKPVTREPEHLVEWLTDFRMKLRENEEYVRQNYWPMRPKSCGFGRMQCVFRPVCTAEPAARQEMLDNFYERRIWDPLEPR
jgi:hypothetical protein